MNKLRMCAGSRHDGWLKYGLNPAGTSAARHEERGDPDQKKETKDLE